MTELQNEVVDCESQQEVSDYAKSINDWLPVTSSRKAKWWYSAIHNITCMVGAGILGLPYAMSQLGWGPGVTVLVLSWAITFYTLWQMVEMHEIVPGKRFDRYHELGQYAFGEKLGLWIIVPQQLMVQAGCDIVYMVTGGRSLMKFYNIVSPNGTPIKLSYFIMIFASVQFFLSNLPNFNSITTVSCAAAVMSLSYSAIAWIASAIKGVEPDVSYGNRFSTTPGQTFGFLSGLGTMAFAFSGHNVVLEIQATIPSTPEKPSKKPMWKGAFVAYIVVAICYFSVAFVGYLVFGNTVDDNILISLEKPDWLIAAANLFVVIHVIGSYQVFAMPVFDMLESFLVLKRKFKPSRTLRIVTRSSYVALTMFIGIAFPFFGSLLSVLGGVAFAPTSYYIPCIIWLIICKPKKYSLSWFCNWFCIIFGVALTILAPIGAIRELIIEAKSYKFFS
ncbi:LOW QUALITY PROTEIN: lysine histidine transporter 1 [Beta vulgaris subsp. vulgaris]|uniref:LOW QUALITY PROTEIN: lysine histidine transporter 1 n=1 Tax=Beta vulgaris subsp. vulgaris TaxID=3555 RepID=UPI0020372DC5|nr:LOW QUALITY PROTEIN: lysine histidine transporter 1 [Beta vulgaris subsp. vulgaris]